MIRLEKNVNYFLKNQYHHTSKKESKVFYDMKEAEKEFKALQPGYFINKKDISIIEEIRLYYSSEFGIKNYYKTIDPITERIESNYKED